jgi:hypothetical protein
MKTIILTLILVVIATAATVAQTSERKHIKVPDKVLKEGTNVVFTDADINVYADVNNGVVTYKAKNKKGENIKIVFEQGALTKTGNNDNITGNSSTANARRRKPELIIYGDCWCICKKYVRGECTYWYCTNRTPPPTRSQ